jgi:serpin B
MLNNGAAGDTQEQINKVLGFSNSSEVNAFCRKMLTEAPALDKLTKVMIANTIYVNKGYVLQPAFVKAANDYYDAQPETRDFADGRTMGVINQWASDHTEKMIEEVLSSDEFDPQAVSYLLNAIYFKGAWRQKFDKEVTRDEVFNGGKTVPMMQQYADFNYLENDDCQMLRLPYGNTAYSMTVLLPREGKTIADVLNGLTAESWSKLWMTEASVDVKLPRFESKTEVDLVGIMSRLGMPKAFTSDAEFPDFCNVPTYIDMMKQVARIKVNEAGTEAAAVTVIGAKFTSVGPQEQVAFHATRPFLYVISEQSTGAVFFIGTYTGD